MFCRKHFCFLTFQKTLIWRFRRRSSTLETEGLRFGRDRTQNISRTATQHPGLFERRVESGAEQHFPERRRCAHRMFIQNHFKAIFLPMLRFSTASRKPSSGETKTVYFKTLCNFFLGWNVTLASRVGRLYLLFAYKQRSFDVLKCINLVKLRRAGLLLLATAIQCILSSFLKRFCRLFVLRFLSFYENLMTWNNFCCFKVVFIYLFSTLVVAI